MTLRQTGKRGKVDRCLKKKVKSFYQLNVQLVLLGTYMNTKIKNGVSIGLIFGGLISYAFPDISSLLSNRQTSIEHKELIGIISFIGGVIIFYMPSNITE